MKLQEHPHIHHLLREVHGIDFEEVKKIKKFREFDDKVTAIMFGYSGVIDYYTKCSVVPVLKDIKTKTLFLSAQDDPFFGPHIFPVDEFKENEDIYLVATGGGGHVGYYDSIFSKKQWLNKPAFKFIDCLHSRERQILTVLSQV
uniref:Uncharacterized protein n=1 Tax=Euplotes harpa TaxID=151035 RepID=A0A7S3J6T0_9SPIT|mmetsp:Transcript_23268/g.26675  ORF Transcript_23268/g.26675 Transcript_23268/m.26675 type:complete len:144 (+) Transcript_23268:786-1217(+)